jgi:hypothetical protein
MQEEISQDGTYNTPLRGSPWCVTPTFHPLVVEVPSATAVCTAAQAAVARDWTATPVGLPAIGEHHYAEDSAN